jgi:TonB family protein
MDRNKKYPSRAGTISGVVEVNFTVLSGKQVTGSTIVVGSGREALDDEVLAPRQRSRPLYPHTPPELR